MAANRDATESQHVAEETTQRQLPNDAYTVGWICAIPTEFAHLAHEIHRISPENSIFWVHASTRATFEESYRSIADVLALPRRHDPDVNVLALIRDWLQRKDLGQDVEEVDALRLIRTLDHVPLAVNQAAEYINKRSPRVTVQSYFDKFQKSKQYRNTLF
ncbi:hypothetical protein PspLS_08274 [Pyricularia sp. CBS 133598]|nr:hypothetical protein PspLS_08274 [Pyricularia sp. CBS 133598]